MNWANWSTDLTKPLQASAPPLPAGTIANPNFGKLDVADSATREVQFGVRLKF
jgi:hypothetical protein